jgi:thioredoxin 1
MSDDMLRVTCLCAQWCGVCREYAAPFERAAADFAGRAAFLRLDIEDEADLLDPVEVENFPTLLIARGERVLFFGTITPQPATLARLVEGALAGELPTLAPMPEIDALAGRIIAAHSRTHEPLEKPHGL